ncbi:hypothetical protein [uncultured Microscilla sp.]|uniref:hypothetical protein n=1 Tax=uncultured Microscilla sp. TaxID=432653 RepID=UPI00262F47AB|nr:hypothetical protein [uncultured Microscilla sp.]
MKKFNNLTTAKLSKIAQAQIMGGKMAGGMTCAYVDSNTYETYTKSYDRVINVECDTSADCLGCW